MKEHSFSIKSWHYRLVSGFYSPYDVKKDICGYVRQLLVGVSVSIVLFLFGVWVCWVLLQPWIWFFYKEWFLPLRNGQSIPDMVVVGMTFWCFILAVGVCVAYQMIFDSSTVNYEKPPGFIQQAYTSWKDKMCYKITFYDPTQGGTEPPPEELEEDDEDYEPTNDDLDLDVVSRYGKG